MKQYQKIDEIAYIKAKELGDTFLLINDSYLLISENQPLGNGQNIMLFKSGKKNPDIMRYNRIFRNIHIKAIYTDIYNSEYELNELMIVEEIFQNGTI